MPVWPTPARTPRWQRRPAERPEEISAAALRVFARRGLHQTTLDDVAKEAGVSKGTIYLYFKNKEDLFIAAAQQVVPALDELAIKQGASAYTAEDLDRELRSVARTMYRRFRTPAYLAFFGLIAAETLRHPEWGQLYFERIVLALNRRIAELLQKAMTAGIARKFDPVLIARAFAGMFLIMAVTQEHLGGKRLTPFSEKQIVDSLTDIFLHGIRPQKEKGA
ncbi:MAG TPA: TetR/AcrR family transcriptional regulator [Methylomirabilota bacterium]|jgi:AcrR family transcriptional regulator|nr:TetR/AcrR family transcriptional regulator [Methylomirabilota bacterium]